MITMMSSKASDIKPFIGMQPLKRWGRAVALVAISTALCACATKKEIDEPEPEPQIESISSENLRDLVESTTGPLLVFVYDETHEHAQKILPMFDELFDRYYPLVNFASLKWDEDQDAELTQFNNSAVVNYYLNGRLVDQLAGVPTDDYVRDFWDRDIELWMRETVAQNKLRTDKKIIYRFNGTSELSFSSH